jgi:hypothetical protein
MPWALTHWLLPRGREIDAHTVVVRLEDTPTVGYERAVGARTSVRIVKSLDEVHALAATLACMPERSGAASDVFRGTQVYRERSEAVLVTEFCTSDSLSAKVDRHSCRETLLKLNSLKVREPCLH